VKGGLIASIAPQSLAHELGWRPGDRILTINGHPLRDIIDFRFYSAEEKLEVLLERGGQRLLFRLERAYGQEWGVEFADPLFDGLRTCNNHCYFCFIHGLPPGMRPSLYVKDDDYRCSFLFGNFVTLTNLSEDDWERLAEQRLSPLYVSVHATDQALRRRLLGNPRAPDILAQLRRLGRLGITVHAQIVLIPGQNDGQALEHTVRELASLHPTIRSIAIVPVGLTRHHPAPIRPPTPTEARHLLDKVASWREEFRRRYGLRLVHPSDEWYLLAGESLPPAEEYEGFPQLENGVGLVRTFLDEWEEAKSRLRRVKTTVARATLVCGLLIAPLWRRVAAEMEELTGTAIRVMPVANEFFGPGVTVSGLLTGRDVVKALRELDLGDVVFLPRAMFDDQGKHTLDDLSLGELKERLGVRVEIAETAEEVARQLA